MTKIEIIDDKRYWVFLPDQNLYFTIDTDEFKDISYQYEVANLPGFKKDEAGYYELKISYWKSNVTVDIISCTWCSDDPYSEFGWIKRRTAQRLFKFSCDEWEQQNKVKVIEDAYNLYLDYFRDRIELKEK